LWLWLAEAVPAPSAVIAPADAPSVFSASRRSIACIAELQKTGRMINYFTK
jgi:hypothetical protein